MVIVEVCGKIFGKFVGSLWEVNVRTLNGFSRALMPSFHRKRPWTATPFQALPRRSDAVTQ